MLSATGSNGVFSGEGYVQVPYLADTKIKVTFDNIKINSEKQLIDGKIVSGYDEKERSVVELPVIQTIDEAIKSLKDIFKKQKEIAEQELELEKKFSESKISEKEFEAKRQKIEQQKNKENEKIDAITNFSNKINLEKDKEEVNKHIKSLKFSSGSKQSFDENKIEKVIAILEDFKKKEIEKRVELQKFIVNFPKNNQERCGEWINEPGAIGIYDFDYIRIKHCDYGTMFELNNGLFVFRTDKDLHSKEVGIAVTENFPLRYYLYNKDLKTNNELEKWQEFTPERRIFSRDPMPKEMRDFLLTIVDYIIPVEAGYILVTGKNFEGEQANRLLAGVSLVVEAGLTFTVVGKGFYKVGKGALKAGTKTLKAVEKGKEIVGKGIKVGKIGDNVINNVSGNIRKFSEYALTNPSKKGLFVDSWGYKLEDAQKLLDEYTKQAIEAVKKGKVISNGLNEYNSKLFKVETILKTPNGKTVKIYAGWIIKPEKLDELVLSTPFDGYVK